MLWLTPIFEADRQPEQYGYRPERSALDAVKRIHRLLNRGYNEGVDGDRSNDFGEIPPAERMRSLARRISDGRMLALIKAWWEMSVEEHDGEGGKRRTNPSRKQRKGTPQGSPISPLLSNLYMRRFIRGWKRRGYARRFGAEIVSYADDFCVLGKAPAAERLTAVVRLMDRLRLPINPHKTRCLKCPEEAMAFLGYRFGWNYRRNGGSAYIGNRPSRASVQGIRRKISAHTARRDVLKDPAEGVETRNRMRSGWAQYFRLGQISPAYVAVDAHATKRLRQWLCQKHKVRRGKYVRFPNERLWDDYGLIRLAPTTQGLPWATA